MSFIDRPYIFRFFALTLLVICSSGFAANKDGYPKRVLITNDNGVDDPKIIALAKAFSKHSETWVVAPSKNQSGTGHFFQMGEDGKIIAKPTDFGKNIKAFSVEGKPADCVLLALAGIMKDNLPDLIISGINGGPNLGEDWMYSGTIGAARIGALAGIPSIAVSGLKTSSPRSIAAATEWVVKLSASEMVSQLTDGSYLTVSIPRVSPQNIAGVRIADRATYSSAPVFKQNAKDKNLWQIVAMQEVPTQPEYPKDQDYYERNFISIVPMHADEVDHTLLVRWQRFMPSVPVWSQAPRQ
jgi:5'-nucleotidase